ncbi:uncharacterized protein LOC144680283 isoform X2 [Cetorhinus maximus]
MGGGGSKWRKISVGAPEPGEYRKESSTQDRGDRQLPGQEGESGGGQQRPGAPEREESGNSQHPPGTRSEDGRKGDRSPPPVEGGSIDQELDRALAECQDWWLNSDWKAEPGSFQQPNTYTCTDSMSPRGEPAFNSAPLIQIPAGQGGNPSSRKPPDPLLGCEEVPLPRGQSQQGEREGATQSRAPALSNSKLNRNQQNLPHIPYQWKEYIFELHSNSV